MNILQLIVSLSILVFVHELGHFAMARLFGARVEKFYLFFNPWFSLFKYRSKRSGTIYGLGWLPLGGYCQIAGMVDESLDSEQLASEPKPDEFRSKAAWQRLLIMAGGVIFNLIMAFFIYCMVAFSWGDKFLDSSKVSAGWAFSPVAKEVGFADGDIIVAIDGEEHLNALDNRLTTRLVSAKHVEVLRAGQRIDITIPEDMMQRLLRAETGFAGVQLPFVVDSVLRESAQAAGLMQGDSIVAVDGTPTQDATDVMHLISAKRGQVASLTVVARGTDTMRTLMVPVDTSGTVGILACTPDKVYPVEHIEYGILEAIPAGYRKAVGTISSYLGGLKYIFTKEGAQSLGGLGTMAKLFPTGFDWQAFWLTTAFLSIILAVMNLLPIPALDGGHIVFILIEMITRRKLSDKVMMYIQTTGMILLLLLMLYANGNDIYRYLIK